MMTAAPIEIGSDLRHLILRYRRDPDRWPGTKTGLSQDQAAERARISAAWWRQIENGYADSAGAITLADMCNVLGIETGLIRTLGYTEIADAMDASYIEQHELIPDSMQEHGFHGTPEAHIKATPGLDENTISLLLDALQQVRKAHPKRDGRRSGSKVSLRR